jgi:hypothetical protein
LNKRKRKKKKKKKKKKIIDAVRVSPKLDKEIIFYGVESRGGARRKSRNIREREKFLGRWEKKEGEITARPPGGTSRGSRLLYFRTA